MPTIGQLESLFGRFEHDVCRAALDRADVLRFGFVRESGELRFTVLFAAMAAFYVNCGLAVIQASIAA
jgi:hypothetical protein